MFTSDLNAKHMKTHNDLRQSAQWNSARRLELQEEANKERDNLYSSLFFAGLFFVCGLGVVGVLYLVNN